MIETSDFELKGKCEVSKLHLTAAIRPITITLRNNNVIFVKITFMKNSHWDLSIFNERSPKPSGY